MELGLLYIQTGSHVEAERHLEAAKSVSVPCMCCIPHVVGCYPSTFLITSMATQPATCACVCSCLHVQACACLQWYS